MRLCIKCHCISTILIIPTSGEFAVQGRTSTCGHGTELLATLVCICCTTSLYRQYWEAERCLQLPRHRPPSFSDSAVVAPSTCFLLALSFDTAEINCQSTVCSARSRTSSSIAQYFLIRYLTQFTFPVLELSGAETLYPQRFGIVS